MSFLSRFKGLAREWGGGTGLFFASTHMMNDLITQLLPALLPLIRDDQELSYLQVGLLVTAYTVTSGIAQFLGGWLGDRLSRHTVLALGLGGVAVGAIAFGLSSGYYMMLAVLVLWGLLRGAYHPAAVTMLSDHFDERRRGKVLAFHMVGGNVGLVIGPVAAGLIAKWLGWQWAFILLSLPVLAAVPFVLRKFRRADNTIQARAVPRPVSAGARRANRWGEIGRALGPLSLFAILAILTQFIAGSAMSFVPLYMTDKHGVDPAYAAMLLGLVKGGGAMGSLLGGWLSDKWGRKNALLLSIGIVGPTLLVITLLPFNAGLMAGLVIFGSAMYMRQSSIQPLLMSCTPSHLRGTIFGMYFGLSMEGESMMQPLAGYYMDIFGINAVFSYIAMGSVALSLVALILIPRTREPVKAIEPQRAPSG